MLIHGKQFVELDETDLRSLIDDQVAEGKNIEYKSALPGNSGRNKKEFLADISSFSNSAGGYIFLASLNLMVYQSKLKDLVISIQMHKFYDWIIY